MDVIDKQIINDALKQYITYWQSKPFNGMEKRETDSFILRCEELRKNLLEELWTWDLYAMRPTGGVKYQ